MIAPFTILDCRAHTLFEPYTFETAEEADRWFNAVMKSTIERDQTRILVMYRDAQMVRNFSHLGLVT